MLPIERLKRMKEIIREQKNVKISELSKVLDVSEMTVHRDIKQLVDEGFAFKTFGGVSLKQSTDTNLNEQQTCAFCDRIIDERFAYKLVLTNNRVEMACCAHCGLLRHKQIEEEVVQAITYDFFQQTTIGASLAFYVFDTSIQVTCCQPQVITVESKEVAEKFVKGFGGNVYSFSEAMQALHIRMKGCCH